MENSKNKGDGGHAGKLFELNLYLLFLHRGWKRNYDFILRREDRSFGKFDDIVFKYQIKNKSFIIGLQAKHTNKPGDKLIQDHHLFSNDLDLIKYLLSYRDIKKKYSNEGTIAGLILYTNRGLSDGLTYARTRVQRFNMWNMKKIQKFRLQKTENIIAEIKSNWYVRMEQWKPDKRKERLWSQLAPEEDEIIEFLGCLIFAVNVPGEDDLSNIIKNEIGEQYNKLARQDIYNRAFQRMSDWMKGKDERVFWSYNDAKVLFDTVKEGFSFLNCVQHEVDSPVVPFIGRTKQLEEIHELLQKEERVLICGLGGVGKTELVRKYIKEYRQEYDDNILWIDAENSKTLAKSFCDLANNELNINTKDTNNKEVKLESLINKVYEWFNKSKSLFIFDNANWEQFPTYIRPSLPTNCSKPNIIITSRIKCKNENIIKPVELSVFTESEAVDFISNSLTSFLKKHHQADSIKKLAELLQYLPLALMQAIAYITEEFSDTTTYQISEYVDNLPKRSKEYLNYDFSSYDARYPNTVWNTWDASLDAVKLKLSHTIDVLNYMSFLLSDNINKNLLLILYNEESKLIKAIRLLNQYSLITASEGVYSLHSILQLVIREKLAMKKQDRSILTHILKCMMKQNDETIVCYVEHFTVIFDRVKSVLHKSDQ